MAIRSVTSQLEPLLYGSTTHNRTAGNTGITGLESTLQGVLNGNTGLGLAVSNAFNTAYNGMLSPLDSFLGMSSSQSNVHLTDHRANEPVRLAIHANWLRQRLQQRVRDRRGISRVRRLRARPPLISIPTTEPALTTWSRRSPKTSASVIRRTPLILAEAYSHNGAESAILDQTWRSVLASVSW